MNNKVVIGGNLRLKNVVSGQAKLNNVISGTPNTFIRAGGRSGISNAVKEALLDCFEHVAWIDDDGQVYYQALYDALYARTLTSITAVFEQGQAVIYDDDTLDDLKQYLTVTANYDDGTSAIITTYTLSGTLNPGTSSIQVSYENKKAYFNVTVMHRPGVVTITNTLNGCTTSNNASSMTEGDPYTAIITADAYRTLTGASVSITMGGVDITASAYNNGSISISEVTGSLVITITAVAVTLSSISAVYTQSGTVYDTDSLDSLKTDLVVTALYSDSSTEAVTTYTLSGTLTEGTSTITVTYSGKTTTFNVTVTHDPVLHYDAIISGLTQVTSAEPRVPEYQTNNNKRATHNQAMFKLYKGKTYKFSLNDNSSYRMGIQFPQGLTFDPHEIDDFTVVEGTSKRLWENYTFNTDWAWVPNANVTWTYADSTFVCSDDYVMAYVNFKKSNDGVLSSTDLANIKASFSVTEV